MTHPTDILIEYAEHTVSEATRLMVARHLQECASCTTELDQVRKVLAERPRRRELPGSYASSILPRVRMRLERGVRPHSSQRWFVPLLRLAGPIAAAIVVVFLLVETVPRTGASDQAAPVPGTDFVADPASEFLMDLTGQVADIAIEDSYFVSDIPYSSDVPPSLSFLFPNDVSVGVEEISDEQMKALISRMEAASSM